MMMMMMIVFFLFHGKKQKTLYKELRQKKVKNGFQNCPWTLHEALMGHTHSLREIIIHCLP